MKFEWLLWPPGFMDKKIIKCYILSNFVIVSFASNKVRGIKSFIYLLYNINYNISATITKKLTFNSKYRIRCSEN